VSERGPAAPAHLCGACTNDRPEYDYARSAAVYEGALREALHAFKFSGKRALARPLGDLAVEQCVASLPDGIDAAIAVPLARERERERGFNQAALIAEPLSAHMSVPARPLLERVRYTTTQTAFDRAERMENLHNAFRLRKKMNVRELRVLLIDDVLTTGATLSECARVLKQAGASEVHAATAARA